MNHTYLRGDMYYADLGHGIGSEQEGYRPVVIIQNNVGNKHSPTVIIASITSKKDAKQGEFDLIVTRFGYQCYNQVNNGSKSFREKNGLDTDGYCDIRMIGDWKLDLMAKKIFESIWTDKKDAVMEAYKLLGECYQSDTSNNKATIAAVQGKISRATARLDNLIAMRADGEISKEKFGELRQKAENELATLNEELDKLNAVSDESAESLDMGAIKAALDEMIDFSGPTIDENIIEKFVSRITPIDNGHYRWDLNFTQNKKQAIIGSVEGRKGKAVVDIKEYSENNKPSHCTYDKSI